ncbi:MAG: hypothetical protein ACRDQ4_24145 [Pseudonocardiaceae bacterium]
MLDPVLNHRIGYWVWVDLHATEPARSALLGLRDHWREINGRYFDGTMIEPHITLTEPSTPKIFGQCCPVSSWGIRLEIRIRLSLLAGTHPLMTPGEDHRPGRMRFVTDVLGHEAIHQWQREITGATESSYHGHGPTFRAKANEITAALHLPLVGVRNRTGSREAVCAHWPHHVRPDDYYLRAYLPPCPRQRGRLPALRRHRSPNDPPDSRQPAQHNRKREPTMTMTRDEHVTYLVERTVDTTPREIPGELLGRLPTVFGGLLDELREWRQGTRSDLPTASQNCPCTDCLIDVAGDRLREITGDQR